MCVCKHNIITSLPCSITRVRSIRRDILRRPTLRSVPPTPTTIEYNIKYIIHIIWKKKKPTTTTTDKSNNNLYTMTIRYFPLFSLENFVVSWKFRPSSVITPANSRENRFQIHYYIIIYYLYIYLRTCNVVIHAWYILNNREKYDCVRSLSKVTSF